MNLKIFFNYFYYTPELKTVNRKINGILIYLSIHTAAMPMVRRRMKKGRLPE